MSLRTKLAVIFSSVYVCAFALLCAYRIDDLKCLSLNELGDYLAGAFGPLAIAWLVFGYFQQGVELSQGTEALKLQATELSNAVKQHAKMASANEIALRNHENSLEPLFRVEASGSGWDEGEFYFAFKLHNLGEYCEDIKVFAELEGRGYPSKAIGAMFPGDVVHLRRSGMDEWEYFVLSVEYRSRSGREGKQTFSIMSYQDEDEPFPTYFAEKHPFLSA